MNFKANALLKSHLFIATASTTLHWTKCIEVAKLVEEFAKVANKNEYSELTTKVHGGAH